MEVRRDTEYQLKGKICLFDEQLVILGFAGARRHVVRVSWMMT
jgi:hypothetical protein